MAEKVKTEAAEAIPAQQEERKVMIRIPIERDKAEDVVVWVNDRRFLIKRGVNVEVPACVAEILEQRDRQLNRLYEMETKRQKRE